MKRKKAYNLAALCHHRWTIPILAELYTSRGSKFVTLVNRLGISRDSLRNTLRAGIEAGWIMRNPGYGHPLRPEYLPTRAGNRLGPWCGRMLKLVRDWSIEDVALRKWSLPVAYVLSFGTARFSQLRAIWPEMTPRALALALKQMQDADLVKRTVADRYPPATFYDLTDRGKRLAKVLDH